MHVFCGIVDNTIDLKWLTLNKGTEYGCKLRMISKNIKTVNIKFILYVYHSSYRFNNLMAFVNDERVQLDIKQINNRTVYSINLTLLDEVTTMIVCSTMDPTIIDRYYAHINLHFDNNEYIVIDKNYTNAVVVYPVCNFRRYSESESESESDGNSRRNNHSSDYSDSDDYL
ncbi:hypothetical protein BI079_gp012 [Volepox virus]|uniref:Host-range protein n=1 Tax=Volepox virus TaxID=28874 RepID=A0A1C9KC18_9POXV|nr:hypothetical protein BI079_gp012 [Volepox virus]AOP31702.1 hypothetical protein VPXV-CA-012 [Volepox virus]